jgi:hypothetical protein
MWKGSLTPSWQMMMNLAFYFQLCVSLLVGKQQSIASFVVAEKIREL